MKNKYLTAVFYGERNDSDIAFTSYLGMTCKAVEIGHALEKKEMLEEFVTKLSSGEINNPEEEAQNLIDMINAIYLREI